MYSIIPAILPKSFADLKQHLALVQGIAPVVQIDVVDGILRQQKRGRMLGERSLKNAGPR